VLIKDQEFKGQCHIDRDIDLDS